MATRAELHTQLRRHAVCETTTVLTDTDLDGFLNAALERIQHSHDWKGQQTTSATIAYGPTTNGSALPSDFITEVRLNEVLSGSSDPSLSLAPVPKVERGQWIQRIAYQSSSRTFPTPSLAGFYYYLWDEKLFVVPNPSTAMTFVLDYIATLADVSVTTTTNFFTLVHPALVKWGALVEAYTFLHEDERAGNAEAMFQKYWDAARKSDISAKAGGDAPRTRGV
jgi:hypothetical protein